MSSFGEILRQLRTERNLKQSDLATVGISRSHIALLEANKRMPSYEMLQHFANKLQVSPAVFFSGQEDEEIQRISTTLVQQAELAESQKNWQNAHDCWVTVQVVGKSNHIPSLVTLARWHQAMALTHLARWQEALNLLLPLFVAEDFPSQHASTYELLSILARCFRELGQVDQFITFTQLAGHSVSTSDARWARSQVNLGTGYLMLGDLPRADECYRSAIEASSESGDGVVEAWARVGWIATQFDRALTEGVPAVMQRIEHLNSLLHPDGLMEALRHIRIVLHRLSGEYQAAKELLLEYGDCPHRPELAARLLEEHILLAAALRDEAFGQEALDKIDLLPLNGPLRIRLWTGVAEYYIVFKRFDLARHAVHRAYAESQTIHYRDFTRLMNLMEVVSEKNPSVERRHVE